MDHFLNGLSNELEGIDHLKMVFRKVNIHLRKKEKFRKAPHTLQKIHFKVHLKKVKGEK